MQGVCVRVFVCVCLFVGTHGFSAVYLRSVLKVHLVMAADNQAVQQRGVVVVVVEGGC